MGDMATNAQYDSQLEMLARLVEAAPTGAEAAAIIRSFKTTEQKANSSQKSDDESSKK